MAKNYNIKRCKSCTKILSDKEIEDKKCVYCKHELNGKIINFKIKQ